MFGQAGPHESSDTGDVLIRSTRTPHPVPLRMSDQRLRSSVTDELRRKPDMASPPRAAGPSQPDRMKRPEPPKEIREPRRQPPAAQSSPDRKLSGGTREDQQPGHDLLTSRFHPGGRGVGLAALKQRSHSAPHRREVKVQLLDPGPLRTSSQNAVGVEGRKEAGPFSGFLGDVTDAFIKKPLLESSLAVVTGPSPVTSDLTASGTLPLQVTQLDPAAGVLSHHQQSSPMAMATCTVAMGTTRHDRWTEQTRDASVVSSVTLQPAGSLQPSTNDGEGWTRRANETLRETERTKNQLKMLLRPEDSLKTTASGPDRHPSQQSQSQSHQGPFQPLRPHQCQSRSQQQFQDTLVQRTPVVLSVLEEAGLVLHRVRRQKKVLEENLDALLRAQTGEVLHCQLDALAANRDWREEVRVKKTVDAWINTSTRDIQEEVSSEGPAMTSQQRAAGSSAHTGRGRPANALRATGRERAAGRGRRGPMLGAEPDPATGESYLTRLYGRAPYEGLRRTLKKSPYLRFSSPVSPLSRKPRPRLVESVTGVKVKSRKTQTSPGGPQDCDIISSCQLTCGDLTESPAVRGSVAMAIPLGHPRTVSSSMRLAERRQEVTSPTVAAPAHCVVDEDAGAPESHGEEQPEAPPPPDIIEKSEEEDVFPGTEFLSVADVVQEELSLEGEEEVQLDGGPSPPPVLYQGPVFPPQTRSVLHTTDQVSVRDLDLQRDVLENRLVEWVEQQLMSRMISEMYPPPPSGPTHKGPTDQSESLEQSAASDTAVAGGGGLQLFVDSNMSVDSALIRQLVSEVLTEQVALLLGQRESLDPEPEPPEPGPGSREEDELVPLIPAPVPTPRHSSREATPPPSEPTSMLNDESPQPITAQEPVVAPTSSLEPAPSAGSPSAVHQAPPPLTWENVELPLDEERPEEHLETRADLLVMSVAEEEPLFFSPLPPPYISPPPSPSPLPRGPDPRPESPLPRGPDPRPESPLPRGPDPRPESPLPRGPDPRPASSSSSSEESCSTVTAETDAALKHISEGELLLSVHQLAAMAEDSVFSFSSSLQEIQEMDFDPISEGQVRGHDWQKSKKGARRRDRGEEVRQSGTEQDSTCSPGQIRMCAVSFEATNQSSVAVGDLMAETIGTLTSDLQTDGSSSPSPHLDDTLITAQRGVVREEEEEEEEEEVSVAAETNSSTDVF